ncbi:HAD family hydrolase [Spirillospora sp. NBC_00431]
MSASPVTADDHRTFIAGRPDREGFGAFLAHRAPEWQGNVDNVLSAKAGFYKSLAKSSLRPNLGAIDLVLALGRARHRLALVTTATNPEVAATLRVLRLDDAFDAIVTAENVPEGTPLPARYLAAARMLALPPRQCLIISRLDPARLTSSLLEG